MGDGKRQKNEPLEILPCDIGILYRLAYDVNIFIERVIDHEPYSEFLRGIIQTLAELGDGSQPTPEKWLKDAIDLEETEWTLAEFKSNHLRLWEEFNPKWKPPWEAEPEANAEQQADSRE